MAYDEYLAERVSQYFNAKKLDVSTRKMMGGLCYMLNDKMCVGIVGGDLMVRVGPEAYEDTLKRKGCREMNFTGRSMKGYIYASTEAIDSESEFSYIMDLAIAFNPEAKSSKRKGK